MEQICSLKRFLQNTTPHPVQTKTDLEFGPDETRAELSQTHSSLHISCLHIRISNLTRCVCRPVSKTEARPIPVAFAAKKHILLIVVVHIILFF